MARTGLSVICLDGIDGIAGMVWYGGSLRDDLWTPTGIPALTLSHRTLLAAFPRRENAARCPWCCNQSMHWNPDLCPKMKPTRPMDFMADPGSPVHPIMLSTSGMVYPFIRPSFG